MNERLGNKTQAGDASADTGQWQRVMAEQGEFRDDGSKKAESEHDLKKQRAFKRGWAGMINWYKNHPDEIEDVMYSGAEHDLEWYQQNFTNDAYKTERANLIEGRLKREREVSAEIQSQELVDSETALQLARERINQEYQDYIDAKKLASQEIHDREDNDEEKQAIKELQLELANKQLNSIRELTSEESQKLNEALKNGDINQAQYDARFQTIRYHVLKQIKNLGDLYPSFANSEGFKEDYDRISNELAEIENSFAPQPQEVPESEEGDGAKDETNNPVAEESEDASTDDGIDADLGDEEQGAVPGVASEDTDEDVDKPKGDDEASDKGSDKSNIWATYFKKMRNKTTTGASLNDGGDNNKKSDQDNPKDGSEDDLKDDPEDKGQSDDSSESQSDDPDLKTKADVMRKRDELLKKYSEEKIKKKRAELLRQNEERKIKKIMAKLEKARTELAKLYVEQKGIFTSKEKRKEYKDAQAEFEKQMTEYLENETKRQEEEQRSRDDAEIARTYRNWEAEGRDAEAIDKFLEKKQEAAERKRQSEKAITLASGYADERIAFAESVKNELKSRPLYKKAIGKLGSIFRLGRRSADILSQNHELWQSGQSQEESAQIRPVESDQPNSQSSQQTADSGTQQDRDWFNSNGNSGRSINDPYDSADGAGRGFGIDDQPSSDPSAA